MATIVVGSMHPHFRRACIILLRFLVRDYYNPPRCRRFGWYMDLTWSFLFIQHIMILFSYLVLVAPFLG